MPTTDRSSGKAPTAGAFPGRIMLYSAALGALVIALAIVGKALDQPRNGIPWAMIIPFLALLTAAESLLVRVHYREQVMAITLFEAALAPLLFSSSILVIIILVVAAEAITGIIRRNSPMKAIFNLVQFSSAAALGSIVFNLLREGTASTSANLLALAIAMSAIAAFNVITFSGVICLAERQSMAAVLRKLTPTILFSWMVNTAFGVLFAAANELTPWTMGLFPIPVLLLYSAFRGHATALADRARLAGMHRATRALAGPVDPRDAIPQFLAEVRKCFDAAWVELVQREGDVRVVHTVGSEGIDSYSRRNERWSDDPFAGAVLATRQGVRVEAGDEGVAAAWLWAQGHRDCVAAPMIDGEHGLGVLRVFDRGGPEGFEEGELAVLEALAGEAARALVKSELLETIIEERQKLAEIVDRTSDGILTVASDGRIQTWNAAFERITGYTPLHMIGRRLDDLSIRDGAGDRVRLEEWATLEDALPPDVQVMTRSGQTRWLSCSYTRVAEADDEPSVLIVVARDATEAREIERLKDDFVATVSHELRTPLTPIKGWAATMLQLGDRLEETQREEGVRAILRHAERLENLITNILEVTKIERGLSDRRDALVDVVDVVQKVVDDFRDAHPAREIRVAADEAQLRTRGDEVWTEQILSNLVSNALKYSPAIEPVDIRIEQADSRVVVSVIDRGTGIPAQERNRIFERFKRLGDHMTRTTSGSGLGLYIARQLAQAIGGELTVESTPGAGATFVLTLPAAPVVAAPDLVSQAS